MSAYFANGEEGISFDIECIDCILGEESCPVFCIQSEFNYKTCNNKTAREMLDRLVKQEPPHCQMKLLLRQYPR